MKTPYLWKVFNRTYSGTREEALSVREQLVSQLPLGTPVYKADGEVVLRQEWKLVDTEVCRCADCYGAIAVAAALNVAQS